MRQGRQQRDPHSGLKFGEERRVHFPLFAVGMYRFSYPFIIISPRPVQRERERRPHTDSTLPDR